MLGEAGESCDMFRKQYKSMQEAQRQDVRHLRRDDSVVDGQCRVADGRECMLREQHKVM
jgi:hypothetical protein